jgi:predicted amidophosphoribosyltransferase
VAEAMAPSMVEALARSPPPGPPLDEFAVTWVPLGPRRMRYRGYDQSEALARAVGALTGWRVVSLLERESETAPQAKRPGPERRQAVAGAFRARRLSRERVILVDDVMTTGATASDCARALVEAGSSQVGVLTAARSVGGPLPARCYNSAGFRPGSVVARRNLFR